ncbi:Thiamin ABC transporter, ATPase component [Serinicoccus hydrothermalis]|uniref:ABC-type quaternary amine transporter n=1 Tax=Serinicoccus hydrothermalis TaxID=1758689 RepID=A0A1B1NEH4_9MICO|nr:ABC transporter ATP-binding protein [Serinicoccus hydrothermalis]ANS79828.1 Thiamin ABC transporter, ATPase component [Serinicoccus hydrothermalis]
MLELTDLTVTFPGATAVDHVSLQVAQGSVLAVLGPSGCGKSTLLRAVAGLERPSAGSIRWRGTDLSGVPTHERGFALMFQDGQLFAQASVGDNIGYPLRLRGVGRGARASRVAELLELVGLPGYADRRPATLSGGEQQRVALARSLAADPELLLLDEPLSSLDRALRDRLAGDLREILVSTGTTAILVTHDHDEAFSVADRMAVMLQGRIAQEGDSTQVWRAPVSREVAAFIGYDTILEGPAAQTLRDLLDLSADRASGLAASSDRASGLVALRRSALRVDPGGSLTGTVRRATTVSDAVHLTVEVERLGRCEALSSELGPQAGDTVALTVDPRGVAALPTPDLRTGSTDAEESAETASDLR